MRGPWRLRVDVAGRSTEVQIGEGVRSALAGELRARFPKARRFGLVVDRHVEEIWPTRDVLQGDGAEPIRVVAPAGEASKTRRVLSSLQDRLLPLTRDEPVVAIGGGGVIDAAGFAAATVRRGLPWVAVPTTVVAMADAAVGGKVAVNHPSGKNLLGAFHPPVLVLADVEYLATVPARDVTAGLAEVYKSARIGDADLLAALRRGPPADPAAWIEALRRAIAVKALLVEVDERDTGPRRALNYGHTVGHALETLLGNEAVRHGEGIAIGMGVAARIAVARGLLPEREARAQREDLERLGLPVDRPASAEPDRILATMGRDKKRRPGTTHTFVLPAGECGVTIVEDVTDAEVRAAL